MKKIPEILRLKEKIDTLNGGEFDYRFMTEFKNGSVSLATLCRRGYVEFVRKCDEHDGRPFNIYQATGNEYMGACPRKSCYNKPASEEVLIFGKYRLNEVPRAAVTIHRMQG